MDTAFYAFMGLLFAAVIFMVEGAYIWWSSTRGAEAKRLERRLRLLSAGGHGGEQLSILKSRQLSDSPGIERLLLRVPRIHAFDRFLEQSGISWPVSRFLMYSLAAAVAGSMLGLLLLHLPFLIAFLCGLSALPIPLMIVLRARGKRFARMELQLPEAADLISRALRAGHAFPSALQMAGEEMPEPIGAEFRIAFDEINYGVSMSEALINLSTRVPLTDLRYLVIAVLIQRESGGNLAEILTSISQIIRERLKLLGRIQVLSAEGKLSAWILGLLPFCVGAVINLVNPKYMHIMFTDPIGPKLMGGAVVSMAIGVLWMRSIIRIRV